MGSPPPTWPEVGMGHKQEINIHCLKHWCLKSVFACCWGTDISPRRDKRLCQDTGHRPAGGWGWGAGGAHHWRPWYAASKHLVRLNCDDSRGK